MILEVYINCGESYKLRTVKVAMSEIPNIMSRISAAQPHHVVYIANNLYVTPSSISHILVRDK